nr:tail protein X [uncultured Sphingomonas sp.]
MADVVHACQGDTLDQLLHRERALGPEALGTVFAANPGLAALGAILPIGTPVIVPPGAQAAPVERQYLDFWD